MDEMEEARNSEQLKWLLMKREEYAHMMRLTAHYRDGSYEVWKRWHGIVVCIIQNKYGKHEV